MFDLRTKLFKWQQHLDLTTAETKFTAHMFSSPTVVDLDADGKMEIIVGTSVGFVYVLDCKVGYSSNHAFAGTALQQAQYCSGADSSDQFLSDPCAASISYGLRTP